jgi:Lar family restriction alleviation protein
MTVLDFTAPPERRLRAHLLDCGSEDIIRAVEKPLPCPFCGTSDQIEVFEGADEGGKIGNYTAICLRCGAEGPSAHGRPEAVRAWNIREC